MQDEHSTRIENEGPKPESNQHFASYHYITLSKPSSDASFTAGGQKVEPLGLLLCRQVAAVTKPPVRILRRHSE